MSLASHSTLVVTAIRLADGREDLPGVTGLRWEAGYGGPEECSIGDLVRWIERGHGNAYVQRPNGTRGARLQVVAGQSRQYVRSNSDELHDTLLTLPRF